MFFVPKGSLSSRYQLGSGQPGRSGASDFTLVPCPSRPGAELQVLIQPADVVVHAPEADPGHHGQVGEDHAAVEAVLVVVAGDAHAGLLEAPHVHQPVVPQHVELAGHHIRRRRAAQDLTLREQRRRPHI